MLEMFGDFRPEGSVALGFLLWLRELLPALHHDFVAFTEGRFAASVLLRTNGSGVDALPGVIVDVLDFYIHANLIIYSGIVAFIMMHTTLIYSIHWLMRTSDSTPASVVVVVQGVVMQLTLGDFLKIPKRA